MMVDSAAVLIRGLSFIAMFQAVGGALFLGLFGSQLPVSGLPIRHLLRRVVGVAVALVLLQFAFEAARLSGELSGLWDPQMQRLAWHSASGTATRLRLIGLLLVLIALYGSRRPLAGVLCLIGTATLVAAFTVMGHTVDHPHRATLVLVLLAHLVIVAFWFGALWPLRQVVSHEAPPVAAAVLERFSHLAVWVVPGLLLAGATMAILLVPSFSVFAQPYGELLLTKLALFGVLMGLASLNKLRLTPALWQENPTAVPRLRRSLTGEYLLIALVLLVTAVMTGLYSPD